MNIITTTSQGKYPIYMFTMYILPRLLLSHISNPQRILVLFDYSYLGYLALTSTSISPWDQYLSWIPNPQGVLVHRTSTYHGFQILKEYQSRILIQFSILHIISFTKLMVVSPGLVHYTWRIWCPLSLPQNQENNPHSLSMGSIYFLPLSQGDTTIRFILSHSSATCSSMEIIVVVAGLLISHHHIIHELFHSYML